MNIVRGVVVSENQFGGYNPPLYEVKEGERVLFAELKRESENQLTLYLTVETASTKEAQEHDADCPHAWSGDGPCSCAAGIKESE